MWLGKGDWWGWGIVVLQAIPDSLVLQLSDTTPRYYKNKTLINIHFSVFFMQCCKYNIVFLFIYEINYFCKYYNDKIAITLVRDKMWTNRSHFEIFWQQLPLHMNEILQYSHYLLTYYQIITIFPHLLPFIHIFLTHHSQFTPYS